MLKRNKDQIKGTIKIHSRLRSTCLSLSFPIGAFPVEIQLLWLCLLMGRFWAVLSSGGNVTGWMNTDGLSQIFMAKAQICGATYVGQSDWVTGAAGSFFLASLVPGASLSLFQPKLSPGTHCCRASRARVAGDSPGDIVLLCGGRGVAQAIRGQASIVPGQ